MKQVSMHHFWEVIISRVWTWHRSNGGGPDPSALAVFHGCVVEIWRCRRLYTEMKVVVCARSFCHQGKRVERVVPFPNIVRVWLHRTSAATQSINHPDSRHARTWHGDVLTKLRPITRIKNDVSASRMVPAHREWRQRIKNDVSISGLMLFRFRFAVASVPKRVEWMTSLFVWRFILWLYHGLPTRFLNFDLEAEIQGTPMGTPRGQKWPKNFFPRLQFFCGRFRP